MPIQVYTLLHIFGVILLFASLGGACVAALNCIEKPSNQARKHLAITHGVGLLLILVAGFGMLAKLGYGFESWVVGKLVIWVFFGAALPVIVKRPRLATWFWIILPLLGLLAAYLAIYKP